MKLAGVRNDISCEYKMQDKMSEWLLLKNFAHVREFKVGQVGRIADFLVLKGKLLINIEAKCTDLMCLIKQLKSHAYYCDYCFAFIPDYINSPEWFKRELINNRFGLIIYNYEIGNITEVLEAHQNLDIQKTLNKDVKELIIKSLNLMHA